MANNCIDKIGLETSPERSNSVSVEPKSKVAVIYYLSRNGQLEQPHFMEVPLSSPQGLFLKDVINALNIFRGPGMANKYSWSAKRSFKNGFVWQDLSQTDFIHPCHGHEYILKGSLIIGSSPSFRFYETMSTSKPSKDSSETNSSSDNSNSPKIRGKNNSGNAFNEVEEHNVYLAETKEEFINKCANVSTETDHTRRVLKELIEETEHEGLISTRQEICQGPFMKSGSRKSESNLEIRYVKVCNDYVNHDGYRKIKNGSQSGKMKASTLLMKLVRCGS